MLIYFFVYMLMNLGAFLVIQLVADKTGSEDIEDYSGLGYRSPLIGVLFTLFLVSLTGLPPTAGMIKVSKEQDYKSVSETINKFWNCLL